MGRTGSGKTTMKRLASGLLAPTDRAGDAWPGPTVWSIAPDELSRHLGVVSQEVRLFAASLRQNVTLFAPVGRGRTVVEVLEHLGLADRLLDRPGGPRCRAGRDGTGLSAGEAQLLALARVFLRDPAGGRSWTRRPPVSIPRPKPSLEHAIAELVRDRTALIIAHRVSTLGARRPAGRPGRRAWSSSTEHGISCWPIAGVYARLEGVVGPRRGDLGWRTGSASSDRTWRFAWTGLQNRADLVLAGGDGLVLLLRHPGSRRAASCADLRRGRRSRTADAPVRFPGRPGRDRAGPAGGRPLVGDRVDPRLDDDAGRPAGQPARVAGGRRRGAGRTAGRSARRSGQRLPRRPAGRRLVRRQLDRRDRSSRLRGDWPASSCC